MLNRYYCLIAGFLCLLSLSPDSLRAQAKIAANTTNSLSHSHDYSLKDLLEELGQRKAVSFLYEARILEGLRVDKKIDFSLKVDEILKDILPDLGLDFKRMGRKNYAIKRSKQKRAPERNVRRSRGPEVREEFVFEGSLQSREEGKALVGASIKGTDGKSGAISDDKGNFRLRLQKGEHTISISYFGYKTKFIKVNQASRQLILLEEDNQELDEVVIVAVGMKAQKRKLGYAMDILKAEEFTNSQESNLITALAAKSSGVWVNSSSASPGASANIIIRGFKSISRANKPLIILDGIPIDNTSTGNGTGGVDVSNRLIDIDLNDIESISILKGPAGAALYGIRAANGALILNSKKGQEGKPRIRYSSEIGFEEVNKLPLRQNRYAQGKFTAGQIQYRGPESSVSTSYGPALDQLEFDGNPDYPYDQLGALVPLGEGNGTAARTYDPYKSFFVKGIRHSQHLSVSGGTEKLNYYLSGGFLRHDGVVPNSFFNRNSLRSVFQVQVNPRMQIGISTQLTFSQANRMKRGSMFSGVPLGLFRNPVSFDIGNGLRGKEAANTPSSYLLPGGDQRAYRGGGRYDNPFWTVNRNPFRDKVYRLIQSLSFDYQLNNWLKMSWKAGLDFYSDQRLDAYDIYSGTHPKGQIDETDIVNRNINSDLLLIAEKSLSSDWQLKGILGQNYYGADFEMKEFRGEELKSPGIYLLDNANSLSSQHSKRQKQLFGLFADLQLSYKNFLHLDISGRNDWSSTLAKGNRSFFYPSISSAFELSEALDFEAEGTFSYLKLKASASSSGNDAASFLTNTYFDYAVSDGDDLLPGLRFPAFGVTALERSTLLGNADLLAEHSTALEFGLELQMFAGRIRADINAFKSVSKGQIVRTQMSAATGFLTAPQNTGKISNKGLEVDLLLQLIQKRKFFWNLDIGFSHVKSMVSELPINMPQITLASFTAISSNIINGQAYGVFSGTSIKRNEAGEMIIGEDGFPLINEAHTIIGDPNPDFFLSLRNALGIGKLQLSMLWDIRKGGDIWNGTRGVMSYLGVSRESGDQRELRNYVFPGVSENGEPNTKAVAFAEPTEGMSGIYWRRYGFLGLSEKYIEDASWIRLREVHIAYPFQINWLGKKNSQIRIGFTARNLLLFTRYSGIDPETNLRGDSNIMGWDYFNLPNTRGISLKINYEY